MVPRMIDGEVKEVEVEIIQPLKRLFHFPDEETSCEWRTWAMRGLQPIIPLIFFFLQLDSGLETLLQARLEASEDS